MSNYEEFQKPADDDYSENGNDSLWDELSHQQTREIQEHHHDLHNNHLGMNINLHLEPQRIKQAVTETATKFASVAKDAAKTAQQTFQNARTSGTYPGGGTIGIHRSATGDPRSGGDSVNDRDGAYMGPYAKMSKQQRYNQRVAPLGTDGACAEFGLRDSVFGEYDPFWANSGSPTDRQNSASSAPLLSNNYGMDAELGTVGRDNVDSSMHQDKNDKGMFVLLETFRVKKEVGTVANLDLFFTSLYNYYYHRGIVPIIGKGIVELISLAFTLWLSVFLLAYVDWQELSNCRDEETCKDSFGMYIREKPFEATFLRNFMLIAYILLFSAYGLFALTTFVSNIKDAFAAKFIFEDKLGISARKLEGGAVEWNDIVLKILELQRTGEYKIAIHGQDIKDELIIAQRIMRRENFMIAFFNEDILDLTIPIPWKRGRKSRTKFYSKSIEWTIYFCVLNFMFNHKYQIRPAFCMDAVALQRRFIFCGIAHIVLMPFVLVFITLHFFMQNLYEFRTSESSLGPKEWSHVAKWTFREFNELPHVFERRLAPSYAAAEGYLKLFAPSAFMNSIGRVLVFLSGSLGAVCLALAGLNDAILLHVKIGNWNLLWYAGLLGVVFSGGKGLLPDESVIPQYHHDLFSDIDTALVKVSSHTHYYPEFWKKRGWDEKVKKIFSRMFMTKFNLFLMEVASIIVAPIILCSSLPSHAVDICTFVQKTKAEISGTGDHCGFATFDFDSFGDENWEGQQEESQRIRSEPTTVDALDATRSAVYAQMNSTRCPKTKMGKTEKSFFNFKTIHPAWKCTSSGQDLVDKVDSYRSEQEKALSYERQHHIAAAARQLDTLLHLEQKGEEMNKDAVIGHINEHYVNAEDTEKQEVFSNLIDNGKHDKNDLKVHFKDQASQLPSMSPISASRTTSKSNLSVLASVLQYDDLGLSAELNGLLDRSTLDPGASLMVPGSFGQSLPSLSFLGKTQISHHGDEESKKEHLLQRQYMLLERYHSQARS